MDSGLSLKEFADRIMAGTTCRPYVYLQWTSEDERFALVHHRSHTGHRDAYGRTHGCRAYRALCDLWTKGGPAAPLGCAGTREVKRWHGRWSTSRQIEMMTLIADIEHEEGRPAVHTRGFDEIARNAKKLWSKFSKGRPEDQLVMDRLNELRNDAARITDDLDQLIEWHRERNTK